MHVRMHTGMRNVHVWNVEHFCEYFDVRTDVGVLVCVYIDMLYCTC